MRKLLIVHDTAGYVLYSRDGEPAPREPQGVPFLWTEIPEGKRLINNGQGVCVDVSITPHQVILEDIPKSDTELLREELANTQLALAELAETILGGE